MNKYDLFDIIRMFKSIICHPSVTHTRLFFLQGRTSSLWADTWRVSSCGGGWSGGLCAFKVECAPHFTDGCGGARVQSLTGEYRGSYLRRRHKRKEEEEKRGEGDLSSCTGGSRSGDKNKRQRWPLRTGAGAACSGGVWWKEGAPRPAARACVPLSVSNMPLVLRTLLFAFVTLLVVLLIIDDIAEVEQETT